MYVLFLVLGLFKVLDSVAIELGKPVQGSSKWSYLYNFRKNYGKTHRTSKCGMSINKEGSVTSKISPTGKSVLHGGNIMSCGSVWTCPHCASRICNKRKAELDKVLSWAREQGHSMYHVTYTLPHTKYDRLALTLNHLQQVRAKLFSGRWSNQFKNKHGFVGSVRVLETTYSITLDNGWHPHFHEIIIFRKPFELQGNEVSSSDKPTDILKDVLFKRYKRISDKMGLARLPSYEHGMKVTEANENGAFYFTKWGLSTEMTGRVYKSGKKGSLNPFEILNSSDPEMIKLGREYIKDMEGQRAIVMSQGLKIMSVVDHMDDMDLLKSEVENVEEWDVHTPHSVWQHIKLNKQLALYEQLILLHKSSNEPFYPEWALHTLLEMEQQGIVTPFDNLEPPQRAEKFKEGLM